MCHPEASHELLSISILFSEAEGSAPLHHRVITFDGIIGNPEEQQSRSFASRLSVDNDWDVACSAQDGASRGQ
jgi:hypothetical protein